MVSRLTSAVLALVMSLAAAGSVWAQQVPIEGPRPSPRATSLASALDFAENAFVYGDYENVVEVLAPLLLPEAPTDADERVLIRAYTLLATSAHFEMLGPHPAEMAALADAAFLEVLLIDPRYRLDPLLYPPRVIARFEAVRTANAERLDAMLGEGDSDAVVYVEREVRAQSRFVSMLPFGYGFFTSGRTGAGLGYALSEAALGGTMVGLFIANEVARGSDGFVPDAERARNRGTAQVVSSSLFCAVVLVNMIHGAVAHDPIGQVEYRTLPEAPPELGAPRPKRALSGWRISFVPIVAPAPALPAGHPPRP